MIVKLKTKNSSYRDLTFGQPYVVIGIEADDFRILNDAGRPFLYSPDLFTVVDPEEPDDWVTEFGEDRERYSYPPSLNKPVSLRTFSTRKEKPLRSGVLLTSGLQAASEELLNLFLESIPATTISPRHRKKHDPERFRIARSRAASVSVLASLICRRRK